MSLGGTGQRLASLLVGCLSMMVSGSVASFPAFAVDMKQEFGLTQTAVETIASAAIVGEAFGYPAGLLYEVIGARPAYMISLLLATAANLMLCSTQYSHEFYHNNWRLIVLYWTIYGASTVFMQLLPLTVCLDNYPPGYRGRITGLLNICRALGVTVMMLVYTSLFRSNPIGNYFLMIGVTAALVCIASLVLLRSVSPARIDEDETTYLIPTRGLFLPEEEVYETLWDRVGFNHFRIIEFHLLLWGILFSGSLKLTYMTNVTTIASSYGARDLGQIMAIVGPVCGIVTTVLVAVVSDKTRRIMPRVSYLVVGACFQATMFLVSIFLGDKTLVYVITTVIVYADMGILMVTGITLTSEYFGMKHFARNWGLISMLKAILNVGVSHLFGAFYEKAILEEGGEECFGLVCFRNIYIYNCVSAGFSVVILCVLWHRDTRKRCNRIYIGIKESSISDAIYRDASKT